MFQKDDIVKMTRDSISIRDNGKLLRVLDEHYDWYKKDDGAALHVQSLVDGGESFFVLKEDVKKI